MTKGPIISFILPAYNAASYLEETIKSVLAQSFEQFELIIIDDGSTDHTLSIAERIADIDSRVIVTSGKNQGVSHARNTGLDKASGEYFSFIDSDDLIDTDYTQILLTAIEESGADLVSSMYCHHEKYLEKDNPEYVAVNSTEALKDFMLGRHIHNAPWGKLYRRSSLGSIRFDKDLKIGEDMKYTYECLKKSKAVCITNHRLYSYAVREDSAMGGRTNRNMFGAFLAAKYILDSSTIDLRRAATYKLFVESTTVAYRFSKDKSLVHLFRRCLKEARRSSILVILSTQLSLRARIYGLGILLLPRVTFQIKRRLGKVSKATR